MTVGRLTAVVWEYGAHLAALTAATDRGDLPLAVSLGELSDHDDPANRGQYLGAVVGPYANRIADARCTIDGHLVTLDSNEGRHHLHGGAFGLDQRRWRTAESAVVSDGVQLKLVVDLDDGDGGYPGRRHIEVTYLLAADRLTIDMLARSDRATLMNLTHHAAWCLGDDPGGRLRVAVDADRCLVTDDDKIPTGGSRTVDIGALGGRLTDLDTVQVDGEIDYTLVLNSASIPGAPRRVARLRQEPSGIEMSLETDQPYLQLFRPDVGVPALCLEPQRAPNAPNAPRLGEWLLRPGEPYRHRSTFAFTLPSGSTGEPSRLAP